jgi:hypothetical protein
MATRLQKLLSLAAGQDSNLLDTDVVPAAFAK